MTLTLVNRASTPHTPALPCPLLAPQKTHDQDQNAQALALPPILDLPSTKSRLKAATNKTNIPGSRLTRCNAMDKYTHFPQSMMHTPCLSLSSYI